MKSKLLFIAILSSHFLCLAQSQIYYPKVEWLQKGFRAWRNIENSNSGLLEISQKIQSITSDSFIFSFQKPDSIGYFNAFDSTNSVFFSGKNSNGFYSVLIENHSENSNLKNELLIVKRLITGNTFTSEPQWVIYNPYISKKELTWNLQNYGIFKGIMIDTSYYFIIQENFSSTSLKKNYLIKTDKNLNILIKYPFSSIDISSASLNYSNGNILIHGTSSLYDSHTNSFISYPSIYFYNKDNLNVNGKRVFKTTNTLYYNYLGVFHKLKNSNWVGITSNLNNYERYVLKIDSNFNFIDSTSSIQGIPNSYSEINENSLIGILHGGKSNTFYLFDYCFELNDFNAISYDLGFYNAEYLTLIKENNKYYIYGNKLETDSFGGENLNRIFRIVLDTNGIPIESRQPPTYLIENQIIGKFTLNVFPNPTSGLINVVSDHLKKLNVEIYNVQGKLIITTEISTNLQLNLEQQPEGIYLIKFTDINGASTTRKVIKY